MKCFMMLVVTIVIYTMNSTLLAQSDSKNIKMVEVYDTTKMEEWYNDCIKDIKVTIPETYASVKIAEWIREKCKTQAKGIWSKMIKVVEYKKNGEVIKLIPCSEVIKKSDIKLCEEEN